MTAASMRPAEVRENVALAPLTTWRVGGPARFLCAPADLPALRRALAWARAQGLPVCVLGRGSNVLVADAGFPGLVLLTRASFQDLRHEPDTGRIHAGAGVFLPRLSKFAAGLGHGGYEFYIGIPGTVGGAVFSNAGYKKGDPCMTDRLCDTVTLLRGDDRLETVAYAGLHPDYRHTDLVAARRLGAPDTLPDIVLAATFALREPASPAAIRARTSAHLAMRKRTQPLSRPTAGSVFRAARDGTPAAVYIDRAGLKGLRVGGAEVSRKHANWIENTGGATAADVRALIDRIRTTVWARDGVELVAEIEEIG
jgi:UDP-N-acetylmuramate dehydrogenase